MDTLGEVIASSAEAGARQAETARALSDGTVAVAAGAATAVNSAVLLAECARNIEQAADSLGCSAIDAADARGAAAALESTVAALRPVFDAPQGARSAVRGRARPVPCHARRAPHGGPGGARRDDEGEPAQAAGGALRGHRDGHARAARRPEALHALVGERHRRAAPARRELRPPKPRLLRLPHLRLVHRPRPLARGVAVRPLLRRRRRRRRHRHHLHPRPLRQRSRRRRHRRHRPRARSAGSSRRHSPKSASPPRSSETAASWSHPPTGGSTQANHCRPTCTHGPAAPPTAWPNSTQASSPHAHPPLGWTLIAIP